MSPSPDEFCIRPFHEGEDVKEFSCGNAELDEFLTSSEVAEYQAEMAGKTYLVYELKTWTLVAYFTLSSDRLEFPKDWIKRSKSKHIQVRNYPACLLGRLAVDNRHMGRGIGGLILKHIFTGQLESAQAVRFVRLTAYHESLEWYLKRGFAFVSDKEEEKAGDPDLKPRLFFDLASLAGVMSPVSIPSCSGD